MDRLESAVDLISRLLYNPIALIFTVLLLLTVCIVVIIYTVRDPSSIFALKPKKTSSSPTPTITLTSTL